MGATAREAQAAIEYAYYASIKGRFKEGDTVCLRDVPEEYAEYAHVVHTQDVLIGEYGTVQKRQKFDSIQVIVKLRTIRTREGGDPPVWRQEDKTITVDAKFLNRSDESVHYKLPNRDISVEVGGTYVFLKEHLHFRSADVQIAADTQCLIHQISQSGKTAFVQAQPRNGPWYAFKIPFDLANLTSIAPPTRIMCVELF